jgi:hypothetical protein
MSTTIELLLARVAQLESQMIMLKEQKLKEWITIRTKTSKKSKLDILPKEVLLQKYIRFKNSVLAELKEEMKLGWNLGRVQNFPESISENLAMYILISLGYRVTGKCKGDILFCQNDKWLKGEVKCCYNGPSQFSPKNNEKENDCLFYIDASQHILTGYFTVYKFDEYIEDLKSIKINEKQTLCDQQYEKRRPRCNLKNAWKDIKENMDSYKIYSGNIYDLLK